MSTGGPPRVAIADDVDDIRLMVRIALEVEGCEVVGEATTGREAIDVVAHTHPDVLLLDLAMPVMDGMDALPILRQRSPETAVIVYSAQFTDAMVASLTTLGAARVLSKLTVMTELSRHVHEVVDASPRRPD